MHLIIGGGPAGNYLAYNLSRKGYDVKVIEEHKEIGKPVSCTGILTSQINKLLKIKKKFLINKCKIFRIHISKDNFIEIKLKNPNPIIDRTKFDQYLANMALDQGTEYILGKKFKSINQNYANISNKKIKYDYLIGADGPNSLVGRCAGMFKQKQLIIGAQARVKYENNPNIIETWLGKGEFSWIVPENETYARIGLVSTKNAGHILHHFLRLKKINKILEWQSGIIPIYDPNLQIQKNNIMLIGDAASQVKSTTYGGILFGMHAAKILAKDPKNYAKNFNKKFKKDLFLSKKMRDILNKFTIKDYTELINMFQQQKTKKILETHDRDYPSKFIFKLILKEPRLLKYIKKIY